MGGGTVNRFRGTSAAPQAPESIWTELMGWAEDTTSTSGKPPVVMLTGNWRSIFDQLEQADLGSVQVVRFDPTTADHDNLKTSPSDFLSEIENIAVALAGMFAPLYGLVVAVATALGSKALDLHERWKAIPADKQNAGTLIVEIVGNAVDKAPTMLLIDNITELDTAEHIWKWFSHAARSRFPGEVVLVFGGDGPRHLEPHLDRTDPLTGQPIPLKAIRDAVASGWAEYRWLEPLTRERLREWIGPCERVVEDKLIARSGGDDLYASKIWHDWLRSGHVIQIEGQWVQADRPEPFDQHVDEVIGQHPDISILVVDRALTIAALAGVTFSGSAVFDHIVDNESEVSRDIIEEWFDLITSDGAGPGNSWLLERDSGIEVQ